MRNIDVQIISATNRDVNSALQNKNIRHDLYHRLANIKIHMPSLHKREDDFEMLVEHFIKKYEEKYDITAPEITPEIMKRLKESNWSGNIRQLDNFIQNFCLFGHNLGIDEISNWLEHDKYNDNGNSNGKLVYHFKKGDFNEIEDAKRCLINKIMQKYNNNKSKAAKHLGISYPGLQKMLERYNQ